MRCVGPTVRLLVRLLVHLLVRRSVHCDQVGKWKDECSGYSFCMFVYGVRFFT